MIAFWWSAQLYCICKAARPLPLSQVDRRFVGLFSLLFVVMVCVYWYCLVVSRRDLVRINRPAGEGWGMPEAGHFPHIFGLRRLEDVFSWRLD